MKDGDWRNTAREMWGMPALPPEEDTRYMNYILIKDIERCPYVGEEPEHDAWVERYIVKLKQIAVSRGWKPSKNEQKT